MKKELTKLSIKIFDFIYKMQNKNHNKKMADLKTKLNSKVLSATYCDERIHTNSCATLTIKNNSKNTAKANQAKIKKLFETFMNNKEKLFEYIKKGNTPVYKIKNADKILAFVNEQEGFILPKKGLDALYLNLILNKKISFKTPEMFVLRTYDVNMYAFLYQFYNWYSFKMNLTGFEEDSQEYFKHVFEICETNKINQLSFEEVIKLKSAIKRDVEAIDFVISFVKEKSMAKKNLEKIKLGNSVSI